MRLRTAVAIGFSVFLLGIGPAPAAPAQLPIRIVYAGDWTGSMEIFAADPTGRAPLGQLTFDRPGSCYSATACGLSRPLPSPDGRRLAYWSKEGTGFAAQTLFLAEAAGTGAHALGYASAATWSPDSRRFAYCAADGTHVLTGGRDRIVLRSSGTLLRYSPDGKTLGILAGSTLLLLHDGHARTLVKNALAGFAWLADGRSIAYATQRGIELAALAGGPPRLLHRATETERFWLSRAELAFSPDGRYLASAFGAIRITDMHTLRVRLTRADGHDISWLPDGRLLYVEGNESFAGDSITTGDVRTVTPGGSLRTIVSAAEPYGGQIVAAAWTVAAPGIRYRTPEQVDGIFAGGPVQEIAADGPRIAFIACGGVSVWNSVTSEIASVQRAPDCRASYSRGHVYSLGIAGDRVGWVEKGWGLCFQWQAREATIGSSPIDLGSGGGCLGGTPPDGIGTFLGSGSVLIRSAWRLDYGVSPPVLRSQTIERVDRGGCPCPPLSSSPGPYTPLDVDAGRIVVSGDNETRILAADGTTVQSLPVPTLAAQLDGSDLVLAAGRQLRVYDADTGSLGAAWPLPLEPAGHDCDLFGDPSCSRPVRLTIGGLSHGFAVYGIFGQVYVLRLADGAVYSIGTGTLARFSDAGLVLADGARIRVIPFDQLPPRS